MNRTWIQIVKFTYWLQPDASRALMHLPPTYTPWPATGVHRKFFNVRKPDRAWAKARTELSRLEKEAARQVAIEDAEAKRRRWEALRVRLSQLRPSCGTSTETLKILKALSNAGGALIQVRVDFDGNTYKITGKKHHSSPYRDNGRRRSDDRLVFQVEQNRSMISVSEADSHRGRQPC